MAKKSEEKAKKNGTRSEGVERARYKRRLPVAIDEVAAAQKGRELAKVVHERDAFLEERREQAAEHRSRLKYFDERIEELATSVDESTEMQEVQCVERLIVETSEVQVVRLDTGEVVETRAADAKDRQEVLDLDLDKRAAKKVADATGRSRPAPNDLWAVSSGDKLAHHFADGAKESACGLPYIGAPALTPAPPEHPVCEECTTKRSTIGAALAKSKRSKSVADEVAEGMRAEEAAAKAYAKKGTAAARKKRGGKTTVVGADEE